MKFATRTLSIVFVTLAMALGAVSSADAHGRGGHWGGGHRGWGPGVFWGGIGLGLGLGYIVSQQQPEYVVVPPPVTYYDVPPPPAAPAQPAPIFYPRNGQSAEQTEADRQECNRWATTQPSAMSSASVFQRATLACMDGRGYSSR